MAGRRRALIVANGEYDNAGLRQLGSPAADADALAEVLGDRAISDFEVRVVRNEASHVVQGEIEDLCAEGRPDDVLLLHFSCHGLKDDGGGLYFAARNTRPDRLRSTAVPAQFVQQCLRQSRSRSIVLLLDCCYGGAFGQGVAVRASGDANVLDSFRGGRGRAVITASNSIEYAFEGARLASDEPARPSVFTSALVEGLRTGEADRDEDGLIALGELYEYLFDRVRERNPKQTPSRDIEMQGELYLAKSRRRRIKPSAVTPDLAAAIGAENPFTRLGAVAELRRRLSSENLPVAMGAFEALKSMASTDIEHVAAAASDALRSAEVRVEPARLRLSAPAGEVASATLRAAGPPVAREIRFEASHEWIRVAEGAGGAELSVTAGSPGVRRGKVVATGPTGAVVVEVEIEAQPSAAPDPVSVAELSPDPVLAAEVVPKLPPPAAPEPALVAEVVPEPEPAAPVAPMPAPSAEPAPESAPATEPLAGPENAAERPNATLGALDAPNATLGASNAPNATLGRIGQPPTAPDHQPETAAPSPSAQPQTSVDPAGGFAGILAIAGAVFAVAGLGLAYYYDDLLATYRPGLPVCVALVAAVALVAGFLTLHPRTRRLTGPALLAGAGFAALFGLLRFAGEGVVIASEHSDSVLGAGYVFELVAHGAIVLAGACAVVVLRRHGLGAGMVRGWERWATITLGAVGGAGWLVQHAALAASDPSAGEQTSAYFVPGAVLTALLPVLAAVLRPPAVGVAVLGAGAAGLAGVLAPTIAVLEPYTAVSVAGEAMAGSALAWLLILSVVMAVRLRRNQPIERQP
ncbi:caspase family protein [Amycolatopsis sp. OK19-0408]|uniref:Caspase family protein n=1 Tax=Amycolatopsis iheyensis TaxID=2945988 RepID=A0A9X2SK76_9PSEU|nr:caspase family protein [Amycolatopsis iheyensis]MCR6484838.1 caspase family protein [Amycolatopsis iheyensis]